MKNTDIIMFDKYYNPVPLFSMASVIRVKNMSAVEELVDKYKTTEIYKPGDYVKEKIGYNYYYWYNLEDRRKAISVIENKLDLSDKDCVKKFDCGEENK